MARTDPEVLSALGRLQEAVGRLEGRKSLVELSDTAIGLREQISQLEIDKAKLTEEHEREIRETKHFVGLEKKNQKFETDHATRDAVLTVREANLDADKKRFEEHIKFVEEKMGEHLKDMKDLLKQVMERIPAYVPSED